MDSCRFKPFLKSLLVRATKALATGNIMVLITLFRCSTKVCVVDVLDRLVIFLWTKRYKCCINKSANYVTLTNVLCNCNSALFVIDLTLYFMQCVNLSVLYFITLSKSLVLPYFAHMQFTS